MKKCIDCGKDKKCNKGLRCYSCEIKRKFKEGILNSKGKNNPMFNIHRFGKNNPNYIDNRTNIKYFCKKSNCNNEISWQCAFYGSGNCRKCVDKIHSKRMKSDYYKEIVIKNLRKVCFRPNNIEKQLNKILRKLLPNEYKYVGNNKIFFDRFNPDFINCNGQKKIIELYGDYWHNKIEYKKRDKNRIKTYAKYGYKTLIIWEHELKDLQKVKEKILEFHCG